MIVANLFAKLGLKTDVAAFNRGNAMLGKLKTAAGAFVAFKGVQAFKGMIQETAAAADEFNKMAKQVGISSESLQGLEYAAGLSGTNIAVIRTGLQRFSRNAKDADDGVKKAAQGFKTLGIKVKDSSGELRQVDDLLLEAADKFKEMPNGTLKTATAMEVFGRAGAMMIPLLNEGSEGIANMKKEFVDLGAEITQQEGAEFEKYNDDIARLNTAVKGFKQQAVLAILPLLRDIAQRMVVWMKANRKLIRQRLAAVFKGIVKVLIAVGKAVAFVVQNWKLLAAAFVSMEIAGAILAVSAALKTMGAVSIATAMKAGLAWAASMLPFVLLAAAILAVILIVEDLWGAFNGKDSLFGDFAKQWIADMRMFRRDMARWASDVRDLWYKLPFIQRPKKTDAQVRKESREDMAIAQARAEDSYKAGRKWQVKNKTAAQIEQEKRLNARVFVGSGGAVIGGAGATGATVNLNQEFHTGATTEQVEAASKRGVSQGLQESYREAVENAKK